MILLVPLLLQKVLLLLPTHAQGVFVCLCVGSGSSDTARCPPGSGDGTKVSSDPGGYPPGSGDLTKVSCDPGGCPPPGSYEAFAAKGSYNPGSDSGG